MLRQRSLIRLVRWGLVSGTTGRAAAMLVEPPLDHTSTKRVPGYGILVRTALNCGWRFRLR